MKKRYAGLLIAIWCLATFAGGTVFAQVTPIQIGNNYFILNYTPFNGYYPDQRTQSVYSATEINNAMSAAGLTPGPAYFKSLTHFPYSSTSYGYPGVPTYDNFSIKIGHSASDKITWGGGLWVPLPDAVQVYGPKTFTMPSGSSQVKWDFDQYFAWNGNDPIIVDLCYDAAGSYGGRLAPYYWWGYLEPWMYPPYVWAIWNQTNLPGGTVCANAPPNNGWINANSTIRFEVCTGPKTQLDFSAPPFVTLPGPIPVQYSIYHPSIAFTATLTFRFYTPGGTLVYTESTQVPVPANTVVTGTYNVDASALTPGFYRLEVTANVMTPCNALGDAKWDAALMALNPGQVPCIVWPGDVNRDDIVNWADRNALHQYILDANLDPLWLTGPARWRVDYKTNPLTYIKWEAQAAVPWYTADGCYMDADGNGVVNSFDYLPIRINWMKVTDNYSFTKNHTALNTMSFDVDQNYPNPFNPSTKIRYSAPEASQVTFTVTDMLGRVVSTLVNGRVEAGVHEVEFDASGFDSGSYIATVSMTGVDSGTSFTKTIKMNLMK